MGPRPAWVVARAWVALAVARVASAQAPSAVPSLAPSEEMACLDEYVDIDISLAGISTNNLGGVSNNCKLNNGAEVNCTGEGQVLRYTRVAMRVCPSLFPERARVRFGSGYASGASIAML